MMQATDYEQFAELILQLTLSFFLLGMCAVVAGLWLYCFLGWLADRLLETGPFRRLRYRLWLQKHEAKMSRVRKDRRTMGGAVSAPRRPEGQKGRISVPALFWLSAVVVAALSACSAPSPHYSDDHAIWLDRIKKTGF